MAYCDDTVTAGLPMRDRPKRCRSCGAEAVRLFLDLGETSIADRLRTGDELVTGAMRFPLRVGVCGHCHLVQLLDIVPPRMLFNDRYPYFSSVSRSLMAHFKASADELMKRRRLDSKSFVIELASNDGYLLRNYVEQGIPVLGVDPASAPVRAARRVGVPTLEEFFTLEVATTLAQSYPPADVIHANNVLAHVPEINGFVAGIERLLKETGVAVLEFPYFGDLLKRCEFDTIYHQHVFYFSVAALEPLFRRNGLYINQIRRYPIHGGSLRLYVGKQDAPDGSLQQLLDMERRNGILQQDALRHFSSQVHQIKLALRRLVFELKENGHSLAAYGAAAKGCTLLDYVGLGPEVIDFVADRNEFKHGLYMPGKNLRIVPPEEILQRMPDYLLLLSWNFLEEILQQQALYRDRGGKFLLPVPRPRVV